MVDTRVALALALALAGCSECTISGADFRTPRYGIPVHNDAGAPRAQVCAYLDAAHAELPADAPTNCMVLLPYTPGRTGRAYHSPITGWYEIEVEWIKGWGAWAYAHERLHQLGHKHPKGEGWQDEAVRQLDARARAAGEAALASP